MNKVYLIGRLTKDVEFNTTTNGVSVAKFTLAVPRKFKSENGNDVDFINIVAWRTLADTCYNFLGKGRKIAINGSLQIRSYENQNGEKKVVYEIVADEVEFLDSKTETETQKPETMTEIDTNDFNLPF